MGKDFIPKYSFRDYMSGVRITMSQYKHLFYPDEIITQYLEHFKTCFEYNINTIMALINLEKVMNGEEVKYWFIKSVK